MSVATRLITAEELFNMPDDGMLHELVRGELRTLPPPGPRHGYVCSAINALLRDHVRARQLGYVFSNDTGYLLATDPDCVRGTDVSFVSRDRVGSELPDRYWQIAPDLAVEVLSPSDSLEDVEEKVEQYLQVGSKAVVVIKPKRRAVTIHRNNQPPVNLSETDTLDLSDVIDGFRCPVADIFK